LERGEGQEIDAAEEAQPGCIDADIGHQIRCDDRIDGPEDIGQVVPEGEGQKDPKSEAGSHERGGLANFALAQMSLVERDHVLKGIRLAAGGLFDPDDLDLSAGVAVVPHIAVRLVLGLA